jgi:hypothetical protein
MELSGCAAGPWGPGFETRPLRARMGRFEAPSSGTTSIFFSWGPPREDGAKKNNFRVQHAR